MHYSKDPLRPAAAPAQPCQGKVRPVLGQEKPLYLMHIPFGVAQILSIHGAVSSASPAMGLQLSTAVCARRRAAGRWKQATLLKCMSKHQHEATAAFCGFQNLKTAFSTNKQPSKATWEQAQAGHLPEGRTLYWKVRSH